MRAAALAAFAVLVLAAGNGGAATALGSSASSPAPHDRSTILVRFAKNVDAAAAIRAHGDRHAATTAGGVDVVKLAAGSSVSSKIEAYERDGRVVFAEPNYVAHASLAPPNDPSYATDWGMDKIRVVDGWSAYPGSYTSTGGVPLAVIDTGIQATHPDLTGRVQTALGAGCVNATDTCVAGPGADDNGHGTHVAGIAGAATNNGVGVAGVAYSSPIIPVKALDSNGSGSYASIANGIAWAVQKGAKVINMSLGGTGFSLTLCDAVTSALNSGVVVVAAAGNSGNSVPSYPAACSGAIGVAATDSNDGVASFSNYGSPNVFVSAPGVSIYSTYLNSSYAALSGTSMATPFVTGLATVLMSQVTSRKPADVKSILATTSDKVGTGTYGADPYGTCGGCTWNASYGYGRINAYRALSLVAPPPSSGTLTFTVGTGADDGDVGPSRAPTYPPATAANPFVTGSTLTAGRRFVYGGYDVFTTLLRFDTAALPDDATITGATLRLYVTRKTSFDNRNLVGEWYAASNWPIDAADYSLSSSGSAFNAGGIGNIQSSATNDFALNGTSSISTTGSTGLRIHVDGGQPMGDNYVQFASYESGQPKPQLIVTYTTGTPTAPVNTAAPTISGVAQTGQTLTASSGTWTGTAPITYGYQWRRCDSAGANCGSGVIATGATYVPTSADVGSTLRVDVTATNTAGSAVATSAPTAVVTAAAITATFTIAAGGDDGDVGPSRAPSYPPSTAANPFTTGSVFTAGRRFVFGGFDVFDALLRFDTSAIPDSATITGATLRIYVNSKADADNRSLVAEWYDAANWPIDAGDYVLSPGTTAFGGGDITAIRTGATNDFALGALASVSKTGFTGLRLGVDGGQPSGDNYVQFSSYESAQPKAQLIVTYTP